MSDLSGHLGDMATVVALDAAEGTAVLRTLAHGHEVWVHFSMCAGGLRWHEISLGQELHLVYESTTDQDGFAWVGVSVVRSPGPSGL